MTLTQQVTDYVVHKWGSIVSYATSFFSALAGIVTLNDVAIAIGILMALLTGIGNHMRETRKQKDHQRLTELDEQIKTLQLKKLQDGEQ